MARLPRPFTVALADAAVGTVPHGRTGSPYRADVAEEITRETLCSDTAAIMRRVEAGETFVITDGGVLIAELRPIFTISDFVTRDQIRATFKVRPARRLREVPPGSRAPGGSGPPAGC